MHRHDGAIHVPGSPSDSLSSSLSLSVTMHPDMLYFIYNR